MQEEDAQIRVADHGHLGDLEEGVIRPAHDHRAYAAGATFGDSMYVLGQMFSHGWSAAGIVVPRWLLTSVMLTLLIALAEEKWELVEQRLSRGPAWAYAMLIIGLLFSVADRRHGQCSEVRLLSVLRRGAAAPSAQSAGLGPTDGDGS